MNYFQSNTNYVTNMRNSFLKMDHNGNDLDISQFKKKNVIYIIENLLTKKIYIGKTVNLLNRANHYTSAYRNRDMYLSKNGGLILRPIEYAICTEGIQNFRMYPIDIAPDRKELAKLERDYILKYNALDPAIGYNIELPNICDYKSHEGKIGVPQSIATKMKKVKLVGCINPEKKILLISVGMKLFGDLVGSSKDQVKNSAKRACKHRGFYIIYLNEFDKNMIKDMVIRKDEQYNIGLANAQRDNSGIFGGYSFNNYSEYLSAVSDIEMLLDELSVDRFYQSGYQCGFLTYNEESKDPIYVIKPIEEFFNLIPDESYSFE